MWVIDILLILCVGWFGWGWFLLKEGERIAKTCHGSGGLGSSMVGYVLFCIPAVFVGIILGILRMVL